MTNYRTLALRASIFFLCACTDNGTSQMQGVPAPAAGSAGDPSAGWTSGVAGAGGASAEAPSTVEVGGAIAHVDAGSGDSGLTPISECPQGALLCDGFETQDLAQWNVLETGGTFEVEQTHVYGGQWSVLLTIPPNERGGFIEQAGAPLFPLPNNTIWGRMMVYFEDMAAGHFDTVRGTPEGGGTPWYNIGGQFKGLLFNYYQPGQDCWDHPAGDELIIRNQWQCWEWKLDGNTNEMVLWIDGTDMYSVVDQGEGCSGGNRTWQAPEFGSLRLGEFNAQTAGNETRMWMDDIAVGTSERIGCPDPSGTAH